MIRKLSDELSKNIKSEQYIFSSYIIAKELIENSLDAAADVIKIQVSDIIAVEDNGEGIENLDAAGEAGFTSKEINTYKVLKSEDSAEFYFHGFRGQALSAIRTLCDLEIATYAKVGQSQGECGWYKNFSTGELRKISREPGTTTTVQNLFKTCPVRKIQDHKSKRKNLNLILKLLQAFCYIYDVQFIMYSGSKLLFNEKGSSKTKEYAIQKHGDFHVELDFDEFYLILFPLCKDKKQYIFAEKRAVSCQRITGTINSIFHRHFDYNPTFVLLLKVPADINVSVDKSDIILKDYKFIENKIREELDYFFSEKIFVAGQSQEIKEASIQQNDTSLLDENDVQSLSFLADSEASMHQESTSEKPELASTNQENISTELGQPSTELADEIKGLTAFFESSFSSNRILTQSVYAYLSQDPSSYPDIQLEKKDFKCLDIIGQFNQGFIICSLHKNQKTYLVAVDQHAADEIHNFEALQRSFVLKKQRLVFPIELALTPEQELLIEENMHVLERNGFKVTNKMLCTIPVYKNYFFTVTDFYDLLENISNGINESSKIREIMASKACRKSTMIGDALTLKEMRNILDNLSLLYLPWNCPHGRSTFTVITQIDAW
ncbi:DNA mismatch repair protein PMS2 [Enteropsectra breve]|nr:DNA mismatch repair protein PMS2 [Enteropsectra breve]